ncbi:MAG: hypothetical protein HYY01_12700 [Chloroflexi bacterium]|nr:hypothetical protein [Chloroflexota bacterium]
MPVSEDGATLASSESPRFGTASWLTLGVSLFFLTLFGLFMLLHLAAPCDEARLQPGSNAWRPEGVVVTPLGEQPRDLWPGDLVIAVDGRSMESWARGVFSLLEPRPAWKAGQTVTYTVVRDGSPVDVEVALGSYPLGATLAKEWGAVSFAVVFLSVAAFVFFKRPGDPAARVLLLGASGIMSATAWSLGLHVLDVVDGTRLWLYKATTVAGYMLLWIALVHFWLVFPNPWTAMLRRRWLVPSLYAAPYVIIGGYAAAMWPRASSTLDWLGRAFQTIEPLELTYVVLGLVAAVWRYRSPLDTESRRQMRWVWLTVLALGSISVAFVFLPQLLLGKPLFSFNVLAILGLLFPLSLGFSILRYRLFDIDVIVNRALIYGILTAVIVGLYVLVVGSLGALFQARGQLLVSLLAAGLVAVLFQPLRLWLQHAVNRWMYGQRDDPYAVLTDLGRHLEGTLPADAVLPTVVETVARALKIPYVAIVRSEGEQQVVVAACGRATPDRLRIPLVYHGQEVGQMLLAPRAPGEAFSRADWRLVTDLARQVGVVAYGVRLTDDLRRARERLVISREEERRRLRRDLHDGLGPLLGGMTLKLDAARNFLARDTAAADAILTEMKGQTQQALADIRRLAYALRPPALDQLGLASALREHAVSLGSAGADGGHPESGSLRVAVESPQSLPSLPAAVEVAVYRIAVEALTNVARHSRARNCVVRLSQTVNGMLELEVADDGVGLTPVSTPGVGISSMKERAVELGGSCIVESVAQGGTHVRARIPVGMPHEPSTIGGEETAPS